MSEVRKTTLKDRIRAAVRAFQGKPKDHIDVGVRVNRCSECERIAQSDVFVARQEVKRVQIFGANLDRYVPRVSRVDREDLDNMFKNECALELLRTLKASNAITFFVDEEDDGPATKRVHYRARIKVILPEKEGAQPNE